MTRRAGQALTSRETGAVRTRAEILRERIQTGMIMTRLNKVATGQEEMTAVELAAAKFLINKVLPDATTPKDGEGQQVKDVSHASPHQLLRVIEGQAERADEVVIEPDQDS